MSQNIKTLYEFSVSDVREVEEVIVTDTEDGKTLTEKRKVTKTVPVYFAFKKPSRNEDALAEEERAVWWSHYVERGILPEALLLKVYSNYGGILSEEQRKYYYGLQTDLLLAMQDLEFARINEKEDTEKHKTLGNLVVKLRDEIFKFQQEQAVFFENTAESKSRIKHVEYLTLHMSYFRTDEDKDWEPFFKGKETEEKIKSLELFEEKQDQLYLKARNELMFIASIYVGSNGSADTTTIKSFYEKNKE